MEYRRLGQSGLKLSEIGLGGWLTFGNALAAEQAKDLGPVTELEQKVAANPLDHQARFDLATALNASDKRAEATHQLLEIVKRDRKWNEEASRKHLVTLFEAMGPTDPRTIAARRKLSSILFA